MNNPKVGKDPKLFHPWCAEGWSQGHGKILLNSKIQSIDSNFHHFRTPKTLRNPGTFERFEACVLPAAGVWRRANEESSWEFMVDLMIQSGRNCGIWMTLAVQNDPCGLPHPREGIWLYCIIYSRISGLKFEDTTQHFSVCVGIMQINHDQQLDWRWFIFWQSQIADQQINNLYILLWREC